MKKKSHQLWKATDNNFFFNSRQKYFVGIIKLFIIYITLLYNSYFTKCVIKRAHFYLKIKEQWKIKKPIKNKIGYLPTQSDEIKCWGAGGGKISPF